MVSGLGRVRSSILDKIVTKIALYARKVVRIIFIGTVFLLGWGANYYASNLYHSSQSMCYVEGAVVIACQRNEDENNYIWNVMAVKDEGSLSQEIIVIKHVVPKEKFGYFYAF